MSAKSSLPTLAFSVVVIISILLGWWQREEYWITAEKGWGYALGIIGACMMLVLLLYPLRKHWKLTRNWFKIHHWFKMHMILGVLGPLMILFHSNFHLGSLNSNIALFCMLLVAGSGVIGRFAYQKIHLGLYGKQIEFSELRDSFELSKSHFTESELFDPQLARDLSDIESRLIKRKSSLLESFVCLTQIRKIQSNMKTQSRQRAQQLLSQSAALTAFTRQAKALFQGFAQLQRMASYAFYARLFSLWHIFHLPIFFMMLIAGIVHVFAVHRY